MSGDTLERHQDFTDFINPFCDETKKMLKLHDKYEKVEDEYWKLHRQYVKNKRAKKFDEAAELMIKLVKKTAQLTKLHYEIRESTVKALGTKREIKLILQKKAGVLPKSEIRKWEKNKEHKVLDFLTKLCKEFDMVPAEYLFSELKKKGLAKNEVIKIVEELEEQGKIFKPRQDYYRTVTKR